jgi:hypothetical protein
MCGEAALTVTQIRRGPFRGYRISRGLVTGPIRKGPIKRAWLVQGSPGGVDPPCVERPNRYERLAATRERERERGRGRQAETETQRMRGLRGSTRHERGGER